MHSVVHGQAPSYIFDIVTPLTRLPGRANLRSAHQGHYELRRAAHCYWNWPAIFCCRWPKAWNSLPSELRCIAVDSTFRRRLKAELFSRAYGVSINILVQVFYAAGSRVRFGPLDGAWVDIRCTASKLVYSCHVFNS